MSTPVNAGTTKTGSRFAPVFVGFMGLCAFAVVAHGVLSHNHWYPWGFLSLVLIGGLTARLKIKLPGLNGNMSVSLPFIFIAMTQLSLAEALLMAAVSVFTQSLPKRPNKFRPVQVFFNVCTALAAAGFGWEAFHGVAALRLNTAFNLVLACTVHLLVSTVAVAVIISLTENQNAWRTWSDIFHLSFPYYLASSGVASMAAAAGGHATWPMLIGISFVMFVTYRSYRLYFGMVATGARASATFAVAQAKSAAATR